MNNVQICRPVLTRFVLPSGSVMHAFHSAVPVSRKLVVSSAAVPFSLRRALGLVSPFRHMTICVVLPLRRVKCRVVIWCRMVFVVSRVIRSCRSVCVKYRLVQMLPQFDTMPFCRADTLGTVLSCIAASCHPASFCCAAACNPGRSRDISPFRRVRFELCRIVESRGVAPHVAIGLHAD